MLPKDSKEVNLQVKRLQAMHDTTTMTFTALNPGVGRRGQDPNHCQSSSGDSANRVSTSVLGQDQGQDEEDLWDILCTKDARGQIMNHRQDRDRIEREHHNERDYHFHGPYYDQPAQRRSPTGGQNVGGINPFSHDLWRVHWPLNFKLSGIEMYDGSTNPIEWLEVYQLAIEATGGDSYVMANYLPIYLLSSARTWLMGHPIGSVRSWSELYR
jgi:hypothetical protein